MRVLQSLSKHILQQKDKVLEIQDQLLKYPAFHPDNGGAGECEKAKAVESMLANFPCMNIFSVNAPDLRTKEGFRPNIFAILPGKSARKLWLFAHLDVVPAGDLNQWHTDPWSLSIDGDFIYGRGVEDNQQAIASMLVLAGALENLEVEPELTLGLVFMADEETGSEFGLQWILQTRPDLFSPDDYYIVPDGGSPDASVVEIAEKGQLWVKFTIQGKQCHASMPTEGSNAFVAASHLVLELQKFPLFFNQADPLFLPPFSTFVPTKHDANVDAINILPGKDVFYLDCRLIPGVSEKDVMQRVQTVASYVGALNNVQVQAQIEQSQPATSVNPDTLAISMLGEAIREVYGVQYRLQGFGGATVASFLRRKGLLALVWACLENTCHQPNERSSISATLKDSLVFAHILMNGNGQFS